ncbi:MAG: inositol monophosphatase family protein [Chloroflexota bacterium]|nr:inositol monophosphatase family protein [Chloroflexota bacterium]
MLQTAIEAARRAGRVIAERYPAGRNVASKGYRDIVTATDTAAEAVILGLISDRFPDHAILSEEAGGSDIGAGYTWVVDPLDGTTNYAHHIPVFAVSIGVLEDGDPLIGVVHDPLLGQTFVAERGGGTTLDDAPPLISGNGHSDGTPLISGNGHSDGTPPISGNGHSDGTPPISGNGHSDGTPLHVSRVENFGHTLVGMEWGRSDETRGRALDWLRELTPRCGTVRALGSAALGLAYVAAGWLDGYFHLALKPWDSAAGMLLVAEAGGRCTTLEGEPYRVNAPGCLATNGLIHEELLGVMRGDC